MYVLIRKYKKTSYNPDDKNIVIIYMKRDLQLK